MGHNKCIMGDVVCANCLVSQGGWQLGSMTISMRKTKKTDNVGAAAPTAGAEVALSARAKVSRWLEEAIASGSIPRGGEIPSERELAKSLGVAKNTVSAAIEEAVRRGLVVSREGSRKRYAGTPGGASLASSTVFVLAGKMSFKDIATAPSWSDSFLALDVVRSLSLRGRSVALYTPQSLPAGGLDAIFEARPGGIVVTNSVSGDPLAMEALRRCREAGIPAVAYGNAPELRAFDRAYSDHRAGSRDLTRWLIAHGRKRIVPFFPFAPTCFWERERIAGYEEAMREAGLEPVEISIFGSKAIDVGNKTEVSRIQTALAMATLQSLRRDSAFPDALLCLNDDWANPALAAIHDLGLVPNQDIMVAGYDNIVRNNGPDSNFPFRPVVTVDKHNERSAEDLAALVVARMDGNLPPETQARIHEHEIIVLDPSCP